MPEIGDLGEAQPCAKCKAEKGAEGFRPGARTCKECAYESWRGYSSTEGGRLVILAKTARLTARRRGKRARDDRSDECSVTAADLAVMMEEQSGLCAVTRLPLSLESHRNTTVSLDRIDDSQGYHIGNCRLVCYAINAPRKFDDTEILRFPLVQKYAIAREAAAVARIRAGRKWTMGGC